MGVEIRVHNGTWSVTATTYRWSWREADDAVTLTDPAGREIASGRMQPVVIVKREDGAWEASGGRPAVRESTDQSITIGYDGVNGSATIAQTWTFEDERIWLSPITYASQEAASIVRAHLFAAWDGSEAIPTLASSHHVIPGLHMSSGLSPITNYYDLYRLTIGIGVRSQRAGIHQQWALPVHYFCGFHQNSRPNQIGAMTDLRSDAYCCGFANLADGDAWLRLEADRVSPIVNFRSDLWRHRETPGQFTLGSTLVFTFARTYHEAIRAYYRVMLETGRIASLDERTSDRKREVALTPQFNTWGAQEARGLRSWEFDSETLSTIYDEFRQSRMAAGMFVIDDKWEGAYGKLEHDASRFPDFMEMLERIRGDGYLVGLWAAFLRCDDPSAVGLTLDHVLRRIDGTPYRMGAPGHEYYIFDLTQPKVQRTLRESAQRFMRRYKPDLVKFDFGYELPNLEEAAPRDMNWSGERQLEKGLEVILGAMREVNPDLVVMYYGLSPLLGQYYDIHSPDDLCFNFGEYDLAANRRFFFSGLCGEFGMPTYSSSGYDWQSAASIWFDGAPLGPAGSLNDFNGDEQGGMPTPDIIARYNGVTGVRRRTTTFTMEPLEYRYEAAATGAVARSWVRHEHDGPTLIAARPHLDGSPFEYHDLMTSSAQVVVSSMGESPLGESIDLGIAPFSDGTLDIVAPDAAREMRVTAHILGGTSESWVVRVEAGRLRIPVRVRTEHGDPVEWLHVTA